MANEHRPHRNPMARPKGDDVPLGQPENAPVPGRFGAPPAPKRAPRPPVPRNTLPPSAPVSDHLGAEPAPAAPSSRAAQLLAAERARAAKKTESRPPTAIRSAIFGERLLEDIEASKARQAPPPAAREPAARSAHDDLLAAFLADEPLPLSEPSAPERAPAATLGPKHRGGLKDR